MHEEQSPFERPELSPRELREKMNDPAFLPTVGEITKAFESQGRDRFSDSEWHKFCFDENKPVFEFLNEEFLNSLSDYLSKRVDELGATADKPLVILEVGAGNGRLTHFLEQKLNERVSGKIKIVATDSGKWEIQPTFPVENIEQNEALKKYQPQVVVSCWMCYGEDWTADFRAADSVQEYLIIGETDGGCVGDESKTWGYSYGTYDDEGNYVERTEPAPYEADGFERVNLYDDVTHQVCRTDEPGHYYHSATVSFRRK